MWFIVEIDCQLKSPIKGFYYVIPVEIQYLNYSVLSNIFFCLDAKETKNQG
jgi:hypothetical protein